MQHAHNAFVGKNERRVSVWHTAFPNPRRYAMGKFVIRQSNAGFHFVLKASNGEIIATSQVYTTKDSCKKGIESVKKNAPEAEVVEEEA